MGFFILNILNRSLVAPLGSYGLPFTVFLQLADKYITFMQAACKLYFACMPVNLWIVLPEPRVTNNYVGFAKVGDLKYSTLLMAFVGHHQGNLFGNRASLVQCAIHIVDLDRLLQ